MDFWKIQPFSSSVQKKKQKNLSKNEATIIFSGFGNPNGPLILNRVLSLGTLLTSVPSPRLFDDK